jgi:histidine triad (HIT) family protein
MDLHCDDLLDVAALATCILCRIAEGAEPATLLHEDADVIAITPLRSMAPVHVLVFPREHVRDLPTLLAARPSLATRLMQVAGDIAEAEGLGSRGFRLAWNYGADTGQTIFHPHLHLLGGARLADALA